MGYSSDEGLYFGLFQNESDQVMARRIGLKDITLVLLVIFAIGVLMSEAYDKGANDGYWEAVEEENIYVCEVFT